MNYFKATLIPEINNQPHPDSFIEHMTNNYFEKFPELNKKLFDIRGACKFKTNEIIIDSENKKKISDNFYLKKL